MSDPKDIKTIVITFFEKTGKRPIKLNLINKITRREALEIMDLIEKGNEGEIFSIKSFTTNNTFI